MSPVLNPWLLIVIWSFDISTTEPPNLTGLINVLRVVSSNSTLNVVVMPGFIVMKTLSFACNPCGSFVTTVATTFWTNPVISGFCGLRLWIEPVPRSLKNNW